LKNSEIMSLHPTNIDLSQDIYGYAVISAIYFYLQKSSLPCHSDERSDEESMTSKLLIISKLAIRGSSLRFAPSQNDIGLNLLYNGLVAELSA